MFENQSDKVELVSSDTRIASINDRTILAVAEVVRRCEEIRQDVKEVLDV